jgi:hypothetical protein
MNFTFITTLNHNVGDDMVREGILAILDQVTPYRACFIDKHLALDHVSRRLPQDTSPPLADKILDADAVIQCGAPVYWNLADLPRCQCFTEDWIRPLWYDRISRVCSQRPVLNLAAGACQRYWDESPSISAHPGCAAFIRDIHRFCALTTVRDRLASAVLSDLGLQPHLLPCTAIHSWRRFPNLPPPEPGLIALNYMPLAGHYDLDGKVDAAAWRDCFRSVVCELIRRNLKPLFVAHDLPERDAMRALFPKAEVLYSSDYRDYYSFFARCTGGILNRVHAAVLLAGRGVPAIAVGNDTRTRMMDELNLPRYHVSEVRAMALVDELCALRAEPSVALRLRRLEEDSFESHLRLVSACL